MVRLHSEPFLQTVKSVLSFIKASLFVLTCIAAIVLVTETVGLSAHGFAEYVIDIYKSTISALLMPLDPLARLIESYVRSALCPECTLSDDWKQIFVLINFFSFGIVFGYFKRRTALGFVVHFIAAILVSSLSSIGAGLFLIPADGLRANIVLAVVPLLAVHAFYVITHAYRATFDRHAYANLSGIPVPSWRKFFWLKQSQALMILGVGVAVSVVFLALPGVAQIPSSGILAFFLHMAWVMLFGFVMAFVDARHRFAANPAVALSVHYRNSGNYLAATSYFAILLVVGVAVPLGVFLDLFQYVKT